MAIDLQKQNIREKIFEAALDNRKFEVGLFWQRSLFFWGFIAAAFVAYADVTKESKHDDVMAVAISCFGAICSLAWTLANRGSKYWQEVWEGKLHTVEGDVLQLPLFAAKYRPLKQDLRWEGQWSCDWHFSVSRLAVALSDFTFAIWVFLVLRSVPGPKWPTYLSDNVVFAVPLATLVYAVVMVFRAGSSNKEVQRGGSGG